MSRFTYKGYYTHIRLTQSEIDLIPLDMRTHTGAEEGLFGLAASCEECHLLEEMTGEDLSTSWDDWFIINLLEEQL